MTRSFAPRGYHSITPYFLVSDAESFLAFMKGAFDALELNRGTDESGTITHAEVQIGDAIVELSTGQGRFPPRTNTVHLFVENTDTTYRKALAAGAATVYEPAEMPYGERSAGVEDPFGNHWYIASFHGGPAKGYYD